MKGITLRYDRVNDLLDLRWVDFAPSTEQEIRDAAVWLEREKVRIAGEAPHDTLIDLSGLNIKAELAATYHELRSTFGARHMLRSYPYGGTAALRTSIMTSSVLQGARGQLYKNRSEALDALLRERLLKK